MQRFGFKEALWLMATGRATREALLSEAGFEKVKFVVSRLQKCNVLVSRKLCGLWRPEGQLGRPF